MFLTFKEFFLLSCKYLSDEVQYIFWESEAKDSRLFKSKFGHWKLLRKWFWSYDELKGRSLENGFGATLSPKRNILSVWEKHFRDFCKFLSDEIETFSGKGKQRVLIYSNWSLGITTFLENGFRATLSSKSNALSVWKKHFQVFCKFLRDEVETVFWQSDAERWRLFNSKFGHRKLLRK